MRWQCISLQGYLSRRTVSGKETNVLLLFLHMPELTTLKYKHVPYCTQSSTLAHGRTTVATKIILITKNPQQN